MYKQEGILHPQASAFSTAQLTTSYFWGVMTDKIGRKPVVLIAVGTLAHVVYIMQTAAANCMLIPMLSCYTLSLKAQ